MEPSILIDHFRKVHPDKASKHIEYFELLKNNLFQRNTINNFFSKVTNTTNTRLKLSYKISKFIAKTGKPHNRHSVVVISVLSCMIQIFVLPLILGCTILVKTSV